MIRETGSKSPRVRFKGFVEAWEQKRLGEIYTERNERGNDSLPILSVSIHSGVSNGELDSEILGKQVRRSEDKSLYKHVYAGDLVLNMMRAWQGAIGVAASEGMVSPAYITAVPNEAIYPPFMDFSLRRSQIVAQMNNLSYGVTDFRKRLYWDSFIRVAVHISSVSEQRRITDYLSSLDDLITLHQRKHNKLVALKQAMLQKMFPQEGATTPEVRFKGFEGDWGSMRLGQACVIGDVDHWMPKSVSKGIPYIMTGDFCGTNELDFETAKQISNDDYEELATKIRPEKGDILFARYASIGAVRYVETDRKFMVSYSCAILKNRDREAFSTRFLFFLIQSQRYQREIKLLINLGSQSNIGNDSLNNLQIVVPTCDEQEKIGSYFGTLDHLISKHATQLDKLKNIKSACLEKMFV